MARKCLSFLALSNPIPIAFLLPPSPGRVFRYGDYPFENRSPLRMYPTAKFLDVVFFFSHRAFISEKAGASALVPPPFQTLFFMPSFFIRLVPIKLPKLLPTVELLKN